MPRPTVDILLAAWERGKAEPQPIGRTLALLGIACADLSPSAMTELSIGARDTLLASLREELFGGKVDALAVCPGCKQRVGLSFQLSDICAHEDPQSSGLLAVSWGQYEVEFRLPNSRDLLALNGQDDLESKRKRLLERIVLQAQTMGRPVAATDLPEEMIAIMESEIEGADRGAEVSLKLRCESCGHEWIALFDIAAFLWQELDASVVRLLWDVHTLARAYAWSESDILAMTPFRRNAYLEMLSP
jgi:hypothetical protein